MQADRRASATVAKLLVLAAALPAPVDVDAVRPLIRAAAARVVADQRDVLRLAARHAGAVAADEHGKLERLGESDRRQVVTVAAPARQEVPWLVLPAENRWRVGVNFGSDFAVVPRARQHGINHPRRTPVLR